MLHARADRRCRLLLLQAERCKRDAETIRDEEHSSCPRPRLHQRSLSKLDNDLAFWRSMKRRDLGSKEENHRQRESLYHLGRPRLASYQVDYGQVVQRGLLPKVVAQPRLVFRRYPLHRLQDFQPTLNSSEPIAPIRSKSLPPLEMESR